MDAPLYFLSFSGSHYEFRKKARVSLKEKCVSSNLPTGWAKLITIVLNPGCTLESAGTWLLKITDDWLTSSKIQI